MRDALAASYSTTGRPSIDPELMLRMLLVGYPVEDSPLRIERFLDTQYLRYDERFVTSAPDLSAVTRRLEWAADSPALQMSSLDYEARILEASEQM